MNSLYEVAIKSLHIVRSAGIVRVRDGADTWLCRAAAWEAARVRCERFAAGDDEGEAYSRFCWAVRGDVASINGISRGDYTMLVREAFDAELIDAEDAGDGFGVTVAA